MNKNILIIGIAALGALYYVMSTRRAGVQVAGIADRNSPIYGSRTVTNPVIPSPQLQQYSLKQSIVDIPALLNAGGRLFTPPQSGGSSGSYADSQLDSTSDYIGGYYAVNDAYA